MRSTAKQNFVSHCILLVLHLVSVATLEFEVALASSIRRRSHHFVRLLVNVTCTCHVSSFGNVIQWK
jgi:hypothetical protein